MQNHDMAERLHVEETAQRELGAPNPTPENPVGSWKVLRRPAEAHLDHGYAVTLPGHRCAVTLPPNPEPMTNEIRHGRHRASVHKSVLDIYHQVF
jgi:hypothetical protein